MSIFKHSIDCFKSCDNFEQVIKPKFKRSINYSQNIFIGLGPGPRRSNLNYYQVKQIKLKLEKPTLHPVPEICLQKFKCLGPKKPNRAGI